MQFEYTTQVWDSLVAKNNKILEDVQKFGCKLAAHHWNFGYQIKDLFDFQSLEQCRLHLKFGLMYKILHNLSQHSNISERLFRLKHFLFIRTRPIICSYKCYKFSFFPHMISVWNSLSNECVSTTSYPSFTRQLIAIACPVVLTDNDELEFICFIMLFLGAHTRIVHALLILCINSMKYYKKRKKNDYLPCQAPGR